MENLSYYLLLMLPFLCLTILKYYSCHSQRLSSPPAPPPLPLIGHLHLIKQPLYWSLSSLSSLYGPIFSLRLGCRLFVVVSSPSAIEECFTKNDVVFANRPKFMSVGLLTNNYTSYTWLPHGHFWRVLRRLTVVGLFSSQSLQKSAKVREEEIIKIARVLQRVSRNKPQKVDLNNLISIFSSNLLMRALSGKCCVEEEDIGGEVGKETIKRIKETFVPISSFGACDYFPFLRWIAYKGLQKKLKSLRKKREEFAQSFMDEVMKKSPEERMTTLIGTLLSLQESEPEFYTDDVIKSTLLTLISAGTDTSAVTLEWAMSFLLSHPEELQKLREEIDGKVGHDHLFNDSDISKLPYLRCIVNETLRLQPAAPLLLPHCSSEDCTIGGYNIPKNTTLIVNAWAMHRDPSLWDEPNKFKPERFRAVEMEREEAYKLVPFGIGRRACPGAAMAMRTISLALGLWVQCFHWEKPVEDVEVDFNANTRVTLHKAKPLEAVCVPRKEAADVLSQL